jgi:DNA-binding NarL/FixJ family response regulator
VNLKDLKILVVDDHEMIREGIITYLKNLQISNIHSASSKSILFDKLSAHNFDIILLDIRIGADDARLFIKSIKNNHPDLKIIVISSHESKEVLQTLIETGIHGFIGKSVPLSHLRDAIQTVLVDEQYLDPHASKKLNQEGSNNQEIYLTRREKEVLFETLKEKSIKQIADSLFLSKKTIESHRSNLFTKFDVKNVAGLVKKAMLLGFLYEEE